MKISRYGLVNITALQSLKVCIVVRSVVGTPFYLMSYINGRVFKDPALPGLCPQERGVVYRAAAQVLAAIHSVDVQKSNLMDFGKTGT